VAFQIKTMQTANVPIIMAMFHEVQPNGWFWWSKGSGAELIALWKYTFNYMTVTKDLHNIIWLMPFSGLNNFPAAQFGVYFPGKEVVDLSGPDYQSDSATFAKVKTVVGNTMPIPLHESSKLPDPSTMFPSSAPFVLFNTWAGSQKSNTSINTAFNSALTVTRDKVPSLK
jgi:mannan endo-1,4-beta-mannosidase